MKATYQLRQNINALLKARQQRPVDLAQWCHRSRSWISKILSEDRSDKTKVRELNIEDLDRIADFFGLAAYQMFQPGISPLTERRTGFDRRSGRDRRIRSAKIVTVAPTGPTLTSDEAQLVARARQLSYEDWQHVTRWIDAALLRRGIVPDTTLQSGQPRPAPSRSKSDRRTTHQR